MRRHLIAIALLVSPCAFGQADAPAAMANATAEELMQALRPPARTRSLTRNLKVESTRVDLTVNFDLGSARLQSDSVPLLEQLALAMRSDELTPLRFQIEGHTDARGSAAYNEALSSKRAQSVVDFLVTKGVAADRLNAQGKGFRELLDPRDPLAAKNRRVRVIVLE
jgi:outer membrane protein OmpA-like peptidoglycan-associated protein